MSLFDSISGIFGGSNGSGSTSATSTGTQSGTDWNPYFLGAGIVGDIGAGYAAYKNYQMSKDQLSYQKSLNRLLMAREDNAVQRRKADLIAAGMSPVLAAGAGANAGPVVSTKAPEIGNLPNPAMTVLSLLKMQSDIATSLTQRQLMDAQMDSTKAGAAIKWHDYKIYNKTGTASNAGSLAKTIRDALGMSDSPIVKTVTDGLKDKLNESNPNKYLKPSGAFGVPTMDIREIEKELNKNKGGSKK